MDPSRLLAAVVLLALALVAPAPASGQAASCTASLVSSFTPCLSYITNGTGSSPSPSPSPTAGCCRSLSALVNASAGCACLLLTGSVPLGVPVNRTLAVTLPRACNSMAVPLQCKDASAQLPSPAPAPAPGPVAAAASPVMPPLPPVAPSPESPSGTTVAPSPSQGQTRPQTAPSAGSAWRDGARVPPVLVVILAVGAMLV
ncbi:non-specific lipid transfer protein GPI-anchored 2-like [Hordeum vulgare]|uniref:Bifunctional inhibitor/plant lipid transfer protein/seed storage helical domain-containing protein n=1 Tax=Hordeum vulgare subsp. vulgare TaxID=112509 RepID=A0A8I7BCI8_HORVV|nr:non-specific lipid transfer protein GPI-anchored 16-like [Hordeum vulgare subsp. vulgare]KAE8808175.1 non-specific lipid transfer protein GPI-anchored 2-like [Hordeum vulgare]